MTDLVEQLRAAWQVKLMLDAADEIERLRTALRNIAIGGIGESNWSTDEIRAYAEDAVAVE